MIKKISHTEEKILRELEKDSRVHFTQIGKKLRRSQQQISNSIITLANRGVVKGFYPIIDYSILDTISFCVYFKVNYSSNEIFNRLIKTLIKNSHTSYIATCTGRFDLICTFLAQNPSQFNKVLHEIIEKYPDELPYYNVLTRIVSRYFGRKYLFKSISYPKEIIFGGDREPKILDTFDLNVLNEISEDARKSTVVIANTFSVTPKTVISHIKKLEKKGLIAGYKVILDPRLYKFSPRKILIKYHNISSVLEEKLIRFLKFHPNVTALSKTLGEWDIEIEIETKNTEEFRIFEIELRQKFIALIQTIESFSIYETLKINHFPRFLLHQ